MILTGFNIYIYKITEKETGKAYIGKTSKVPFVRWWEHLKRQNTPFSEYFGSTSLTGWIFEVIAELPGDLTDDEVKKIETEFIIMYNTIENGFNTIVSDKETKLNNIRNLFNHYEYDERFNQGNKP